MKKLNILILIICLLIPFLGISQTQVKVKKVIPEKAIENGLRNIIIHQEYVKKTGAYEWWVRINMKSRDIKSVDIPFSAFWEKLNAAQKKGVWRFIKLSIKTALGIKDLDLIGVFEIPEKKK